MHADSPVAARSGFACHFFTGLCLCALGTTAQAEGFIDDAKGTLNLRNLYMQRDYKGSTAPAPRRAEWGQGLVFQGHSGYTPGTLGLGLEVTGKYGLRLDSGAGRTGLALFPRHEDGPAREYGRLGGALRARMAHTELKHGEQIMTLPVVRTNDARLLPQTYDGTTLVSRDLPQTTLYAGRLDRFSGRDSANLERLHMHGSPVGGKHFDYAGAEWRSPDKRLQLAYWRAELKDIYSQDLYRFSYDQPWGTAVVRLDSGLYVSRETGAALAGEQDNRAAWLGLKWTQAGHSVLLGYQRMFGDSDFVGLQDSGTPMVNHANNIFAYAREKSWQVRYDYDFVAMGVPGLNFMTRYIRGWDVQRGAEVNGHEWERDVSLRYVWQSGTLRNFSVALGLSSLRSTFQSSFDETTLRLSYPLSF